jgi:hypothetical protein
MQVPKGRGNIAPTQVYKSTRIKKIVEWHLSSEHYKSQIQAHLQTKVNFCIWVHKLITFTHK